MQLDGNPGRRELRTPPEPKPLLDISPPTRLSEEAREMWQEIAPELQRLGILTILDKPALKLLCETWALIQRCAREMNASAALVTVSKHMNGEFARMIQPPQARIAKDAEARLERLLMHFGLTPLAREHLVGKRQDEKSDKWAGILA